MTMIETALSFVERAPLPDRVTRAGIALLCQRSQRDLALRSPDAARSFCEQMDALPIAVATREANAQHYEVPAAFFDLVLGARRKYSCCWFDSDDTSLNDAEQRALQMSAANAQIADGQRILDLGCGWGSFSLWLAEHYPNARVMSVSNSRSQRAFIEGRASELGLHNIEVVTADMNAFAPGRQFDRIVSIEMFEHMSNWRQLLGRVRSWMTPEGRCLIHVFSHHSQPYRFDTNDKADWIAQHFFTGGIMPSHGLIRSFSDLVEVEQEWRWSGVHYERTARAWLANFDSNSDAIDAIFDTVYGRDARVWKRRWRLFFLATMGLFGHAGGQEWGISHYRLKPA